MLRRANPRPLLCQPSVRGLTADFNDTGSNFCLCEELFEELSTDPIFDPDCSLVTCGLVRRTRTLELGILDSSSDIVRY